MAGREGQAVPENIASFRTARIRALNDKLRTTFCGGHFIATPGIADLGAVAINAILHKLRRYDDWDDGNDPYGEHDFGAFELAGRRIFWKIDYYDLTQCYGLPDPANPEVTSRVLTLMLAHEY